MKTTLFFLLLFVSLFSSAQFSPTVNVTISNACCPASIPIITARNNNDSINLEQGALQSRLFSTLELNLNGLLFFPPQGSSLPVFNPSSASTGYVLTSIDSNLHLGVSPGNGAGALFWRTNGNLGTTDANFIGTISDQSLYFRTANTYRGKVDSIGNWGFGGDPNYSLFGTDFRVSSYGNIASIGGVVAALAPDSTGAILIQHDPTSGIGHLFTATGSNLEIEENGGNVGINTAAPATKLEVNGDLFAHTNDSTLGHALSIGANTQLLVANEEFQMHTLFGDIHQIGPDLTMDMPFGDVLLQTSTGNVGIGITSPTAKLDVMGDLITFKQVITGNLVAEFNSTNYYVAIGDIGANANGTEFHVEDNSSAIAGEADISVKFNTTTTTGSFPMLTLDMEHHLAGIGTAAPVATLQINGHAIFKDSSATSTVTGEAYVGADDNYYISSADAANLILSNRSGNVSVTAGASNGNAIIEASYGLSSTYTKAQITTDTLLLDISGTSGTNGNVLTSDGTYAHWAAPNGGGNSLTGTSSTPSIAPGTGAGTSPTVGIQGTNIGGLITVTPGITAGAGATVVTVTYSSLTFSTDSYVTITPANAATALLSGATMVYVAGTTTTFVITSGSSGLTAAIPLAWNYTVTGN